MLGKPLGKQFKTHLAQYRSPPRVRHLHDHGIDSSRAADPVDARNTQNPNSSPPKVKLRFHRFPNCMWRSRSASQNLHPNGRCGWKVTQFDQNGRQGLERPLFKSRDHSLGGDWPRRDEKAGGSPSPRKSRGKGSTDKKHQDGRENKSFHW